MASMSSSTIKIGEFWFDPSTGELRNHESEDPTTRLPPQPTQLLQMLVENHPDVISREAIQQSLWPGVTSDFEKNLHFCVRQIRSAFGESAASPTYVETIPRRGYRLIAKVDSVDDSPAISAHVNSKQSVPVATESSDVISLEPKESDQSIGARRTLVKAIALLFLAVLGVSYAVWQLNHRGENSQPAAGADSEIRIAIMPFQTNKGGYGQMGNGDIALNLLEMLASEMKTLRVIGPSTTERVVADHVSFRKFAEDSKLDFIVNGKFMSNENRKKLLVEVIRANDGSHVWVKAFEKDSSNLKIAELTLDAIHEQIESYRAVELESDGNEEQPLVD